jgi:hypothetical protein
VLEKVYDLAAVSDAAPLLEWRLYRRLSVTKSTKGS